MKNLLNIVIKLLFLVLFFGCNKNADKKEVKVEFPNVNLKDINFKNTLDNFIQDTNIYPINNYDIILIKFYINEKSLDTLVMFENHPPFEKNNFIFANSYKGYKLYFYSPDNLKEKLYKLVDSSDVEKKMILPESLDNEEVDMTYQAIYVINKDSIYPLKIPLEVK